MYTPKYCLFYDNHTMKACPDVGARFNVEEFTDQIVACGVDYLTFHARCNQGFAYYNTEIGIKHPSLKYDLFGKLAEACKGKGIALTAYINGGISHEEGIVHREWTTLCFDGREYREYRNSPYVRTMCYNSGYRNHLIAMIEEIGKKYPIAGFFIDCLASYKCICPVCIKKMKELGIDWRDETEVEKFSAASALLLSEDITKAARKINPEFLLYFNGIPFDKQYDCGSYLECECLPTNPDWGYDYLPVMSHYMRTLGNKTILNMTGRFYDWGDFGGIRPENGIEYDLLYGLANGMRPNIGDHFHPRGDLNIPVFDRIKKIYKKLQSLDAWFNDAENLTEVAIVYPKKHNNICFDKQLNGAVRMLCELKQQFDVVTEFSDWNKYQVLIFPDDIIFNEETIKRIEAHLADGKAVISSGWSGLDKNKERFAMENEWGVKYLRDCNFNPAYFSVSQNFSSGLPDMPLALYSTGMEIEALQETEIGALLVAPYYNRHWDGVNSFFYNPPATITDKPALTIKGKVAHFSHQIFSGYHAQASVELRRVFSNVLNKLLSNPLLKFDNLPSFVRAFVTEQSNRRIVHILSYVPELRGEKTQMIEESVVLIDAKIALRVDESPVKKVYLQPNRKTLSFTQDGTYVYVNIPVIKGHALLTFEF